VDCNTHFVCTSLKSSYICVCMYNKFSLYNAYPHRLSHTVALLWSAKTLFDLYVCELGQLRNSGWC
jgi:hypothetical protein